MNVDTTKQAPEAVDAGAILTCVASIGGAENKKAIIADLNVPEGNKKVCATAKTVAKNNQQWEKVEEVWICCDAAFNTVWVLDMLYKDGKDQVEHPGAIITQESSRQWI
eukprot:6479822-Ditylum_brightwellii.AAC.1